jgi:alpha-tubulin suppressor-like RCC1 family protein
MGSTTTASTMIRRMFVASAVIIGVITIAAACESPVEPPIQYAVDTAQPAGARVVGFASAYMSLCALLDSGLVFCHGDNRAGEFGDGTYEPASVHQPTLGAGGLRWASLGRSTGTPRVCGLDGDSRAYCWGYNLNGEVGDGTMQNRLLPTPVHGDVRFSELASSYHSCGVSTDGDVYCWGAFTDQLGISPHQDRVVVPTRVPSPHRYVAVTTGMSFTCALRTTGLADCWGWGAGMGSGPIDRSVPQPTPVAGGRQYTRISAGEEHVCALDAGGVALCWGKTDFGHHAPFRAEPTPVPGRLRFTEIASGNRFGACAVAIDGSAFCWGGLEAPARVPGGHRFVGLVARRDSPSHYCGYTAGGNAYCWRWVQVGSAMAPSLPERLNALPDL